MSTAFIKSNKNLIIIGAIFVASVFGATVTTQIMSTQKAEAGRYRCFTVSWRVSPICVYEKQYGCYINWWARKFQCGWY